MRVKKLNANRRPKAGEDDVGSDSNTNTSSSSPARKWVSPTKHDARGDGSSSSGVGSTSGAEIGSHSPTDPSGVHPIELSDSVQAHFFAQAAASQALHANSHLLFGDELNMANNTHQQMTASRNMTGRKPATLKKSNGAANWREQVSSSVRDEIHAKIVEYLRALKPNAPEKVLARLPGLANRMEESLLQLANSQDEYADLKTLAPRLSAIQQTNAKKLLQQQTAASSPHAQENNNAGSHDVAMRGRTRLSEDQARFVYQCLQSWRQKLVTMYGEYPTDIMPNPILATIAVNVPSTEQELSICGVRDDLIARFGSSLLKELQLICGSTASARNATASPSNSTKPRNTSITAVGKTSRKSESAAKRPTDAKKRKTSNLAPAASDHGNSRLAPAPSAFMMPPPVTGAPMMSPSQLLFRPNGMDSLPTLLPSATSSSSGISSATNTNSLTKSPYNGSRLSPGPAQQQQMLQQPLFSHLPSPLSASQHQQSSQQQQKSDAQQENHMHLLAQGAGHMSKQQQDAKTIELYEAELSQVRWQLHQSQQEKSQLEDEVLRLRRQLGAAQDPRQSVESQ